MYSIQRSAKGKIDRYFLPNQINHKAILKAIKVQEAKYSPIKYNNQLTIEKINEETTKLNVLRVNGRQFNNFASKTDTRQRSKTREINFRKAKALANQPVERIMQVIQKSPEYENELMKLRKVKHTTSAITNIDREIADFSQVANGVTKEEDDIEQYERMIVSNPILYKKIMCVYKNTHRQLDKQLRENTMRKYSIPRENTGQVKKFFKKQQNSVKSQQQMKKNAAISQYRQFLFLINASNCQLVIPNTQNNYKCFICKGNNGLLVKSMIKTRPWWTIKTFSQVEGCNLVWTQWKKTRLTDNLKQTQKNYASSIKNQQPIQSSFYVTSKNLLLSQKNKKKQDQVMKLVKALPFAFNDQRMIANSTIQQYFCFTNKLQPIKNFEQNAQKYIKELRTVIKMNNKQKQLLNHLPGCLHFHSKKLLYLNMKRYYKRINKQLNDAIPETYLISKADGDEEFVRFTQDWQKSVQKKDKGKNAWICKPGENSNRGNGIVVLNSLIQIRNLVKARITGHKSTVILQKYMENPLLYNRRKFDFRCFILITSVNGMMKGYWYNDAYVRTASKQFNLKNLDNKFVHLTNDAIQKKGEQYGKFQCNNKVTLQDFEKYLITLYGDRFSFAPIFSKMKQIATDLIKSVGEKINLYRKQHCFELFGLDFMIDDKLKPFLIQANSNPCLQVDGPVLGRIIPSVLQNALRIAVDPLFPPPFSQASKMSKFQINNPFEHNKFELIYDSFYQQTSVSSIGQQQRREISDAELQQFEQQETMNE